MCFSAGASFGAAAVIAGAGAMSISKIKSNQQAMFAAIPLVFAAQQLSEGFVWLTFTHSDYRGWQNIPIGVFLAFAQIVWPLWVPISIMRIEQEPRYRQRLKVLIPISIIVAILQVYRLIFYPWGAQMTDHHIHYTLDFSIPYFGILLNILYFISTVVPPFLSSRKSIIVLGALNLSSLIITALVLRHYVISVWCFFAALISLQVIITMNSKVITPQVKV